MGGTVENNSDLADRESLSGAGLPDLVSFNLKDGNLNGPYLQSLLGVNANGSLQNPIGSISGESKPTNDTSNLTIPMPTPINFGTGQIAMTQPQQSVPQQTRPAAAPQTQQASLPQTQQAAMPQTQQTAIPQTQQTTIPPAQQTAIPQPQTTMPQPQTAAMPQPKIEMRIISSKNHFIG